MRTLHAIAIVVLIFIGFSCQSPTADSVDSHIADGNFDWILGDWIRTNDKEDKMTFEMWRKLNDSKYRGFGYTMQNGDTIWQERMELVEKNGNWSFDVTGKGEAMPTKFRLTAIEKGNFVCENRQNEFPKKIEYSKEGAKLHAKISDDDMEVPFVFEKFP